MAMYTAALESHPIGKHVAMYTAALESHPIGAHVAMYSSNGHMITVWFHVTKPTTEILLQHISNIQYPTIKE